MKSLSALLLWGSLQTAGAAQISLPLEAWYSIYLSKERVGYVYGKYEWKTPEQKAIVYTSALFRKDPELGDVHEQLSETVTADLKPLLVRHRLVSGVEERRVLLEFKGNQVRSERSTKKDPSSPEQRVVKEIALPEGTLVFGSFMNFLVVSMTGTIKPQVAYSAHILDESDFTLKDGDFKKVGPDTYRFRVGAEVAVVKMSPQGKILKQESADGNIRVELSDQKRATKGFPLPTARSEG